MREPINYINAKLKPPKAFWDWAYSQVPIYEWKNKEQVIRSSDRDGYVIKKRLTKRSKLSGLDNFIPIAIILVTSKRIEIQSYGIYYSIKDGKETIEISLNNFEQFANNEHVKIGQLGTKWHWGLNPNYSMMGGPYERTRFFENSWKKKVRTISELKYLEIYRLERWDIANLYKYRDEIEYLQKINSHKLAWEVMYPRWSNVDMRTINKRWLRANKNALKNKDINFSEYELEKRIKARGGKLVPGIEEYLSYQDIKHIPKGIGIISFQNWVIKHKVDFNFYRDYLTLLKDLKIEVNTRNLIAPTDLVAAHDNAVKLYNQAQDEKTAKAFEQVVKRRKKLEMKLGGYVFILPKDSHDLIVEGKVLEHCVGSSGYVDRHSKGKTTIVFLRDSQDVEKPLYTLEYKDGRIEQVRGRKNLSPPEEVQTICDKWLSKVNKN